MVLRWSTETDSAYLGEHQRQDCSRCGKTCWFDVMVRYRYQGLHSELMGGSSHTRVTSREYFLTCSECGAEVPIERNAIIPFLNNERIPFVRRYGLWMMFFGLAVLLPLLIWMLFIRS